MVTTPFTPKETVEIAVHVPVVRQCLEVADVTWARDAEGWWYLKVNGETVIGLAKHRARALARDILDEPAGDPPPVPEV